jgi:hypothetical protein
VYGLVRSHMNSYEQSYISKFESSDFEVSQVDWFQEQAHVYTGLPDRAGSDRRSSDNLTSR